MRRAQARAIISRCPAPNICRPSSPALAFGLAVVFGAVAQRVNFCTMGAISDAANFGDWRRMRMWLLAIAVAIAGVAALQAAGLIDLSKSIYTGSRIAWLSMLVGGFLFGFGMTLGSGCGSKTLIRIGGGNLKSLIVLVFLGISAYMTLKGVFAVVARGGARSGALRRRRGASVRPADGRWPRSACGARREGVAALRRRRRRSPRGCSRTATSARRAR